ncbi:MAG TPA: thioesterase family protein [Dermatophilaceae bacterium]|nr:thioesterase family protein [Dermatophilaceae bacterium]
MTADTRGLTRADFVHVARVSTRWSDNDMFGHLNNAVYYELFDSVLNEWLMAGTGIEESTAPVIGLVVESSCRFHRELAYPGPVDVALVVERLGERSLVLGLGVFAADADEIAAHGRWAQVYVDRATRRPVPVPTPVRALAERSTRA